MTSGYSKDGFYFLVGHICILRDKNHQMNFKIHKSHLIMLSRVFFMATFLCFILFYNVNYKLKNFHKL